MAGGNRKYSEQEASNTGLGQVGSIFVDDTSATTPSGGKFIAITVIEEATFTTLTPEDGQGIAYIGTGAASSSAATGSNAIDSTNSFTAGTTIFGRWSTFTLAGGAVVAYIG
jgi:hypothetical protein